MSNRFAFIAGKSVPQSGAYTGAWRITSIEAVCGDGVGPADRLRIEPAAGLTQAADDGTAWTLEGLISNVRYATRAEITTLRSMQEPIGRPLSRRAALIPIRKSAAWWALAQDERRQIFEETSHHTAIGLDYMPAIARQLYHCRDIGQPFDFLTWFEYAAEDAGAFEQLVARLRATAEWGYVDREVDIRLERA